MSWEGKSCNKFLYSKKHPVLVVLPRVDQSVFQPCSSCITTQYAALAVGAEVEELIIPSHLLFLAVVGEGGMSEACLYSHPFQLTFLSSLHCRILWLFTNTIAPRCMAQFQILCRNQCQPFALPKKFLIYFSIYFTYTLFVSPGRPLNQE